MAFVSVRDIFVPVSPSGTGYTLSSSTCFFISERVRAAEISASFSILPLINEIILHILK